MGVQTFHGTLEHFCRVVAAAHTAQHGLAGMLQRDVQLRAEHAAGHEGLHPFVIELRRLQGADAEAAASGEFRGQGGIQTAEQAPEITEISVVPAILAQIDAGDHDLGMSGQQQAPGLGDDVFRRAAQAAAAGEGHDAVGAAVLAAVLHLEHGAGAPEAADGKGRVGRGLRFSCRSLGFFRPGPGQQQALVALGQDEVRLHAVLVAVPAKILEQAGRTTGQDQAGSGGRTAQTEHGIAGIALPSGRDGATVDADHVRLGGVVAFHAATGLPGLAQGLRFVLVHLTAKGNEVEFPCLHGCYVGQRPSP